MPYCTATAFKERFGTEEHDQLIASGSDRTYASASADADSLIDAALVSAGYAIPIATVPAFIVGIAADLTRYELYDEAPTNEVRERRKLAMDLLRDIRDGKLSVVGATRTETVSTIAVSAAPITFDTATTDRFIGGL
jgi:phage gp36-like protein